MTERSSLLAGEKVRLLTGGTHLEGTRARAGGILWVFSRPRVILWKEEHMQETELGSHVNVLR